MAAQFTVTRQVSDIQVTPYGVVAVERVGATTIPSGVFFEVLVPTQAWQSLGAEAWIAPIATEVEGLLGGGQVVAVQFVEDVDDVSNLIGFFFDLTVQIPAAPPLQPGPMQAVVRVPAAALAERLLIDALVTPKIDAALAALHGTAAL